MPPLRTLLACAIVTASTWLVLTLGWHLYTDHQTFHALLTALQQQAAQQAPAPTKQ